MAHFSLSLALFLLLQFSNATLYYVKPTIPPHSYTDPDTLCPSTGELCLPLNHYVTGNHFASHTVFKFLPGTHTILEPLTLRYIYNVTLEAALPDSPPPVIEVDPVIKCYQYQLVFGGGEFLATPGCSSVLFKHTKSIVLRGLRVQSRVHMNFTFSSQFFQLVASEISFDHTENILLEGVSARRGLYINTAGVMTNITGCKFGQFDDVKSKCGQTPTDGTEALYGVYITNAMNILMSNVTVSNAKYYGIYLQNTRDALLQGIVSVNTDLGSAVALNHTFNTIIRNPVLQICESSYIPIIDVGVSLNVLIEGVSIIDQPSRFIVHDSIDVKFVSMHLGITEGKQPKSIGLFIYTSTNVSFVNSSFTDSDLSKSIDTDIVSLPATFFVYFSNGIEFNNCTFARNQQSVINARASEIVFSKNVAFLDNYAPSGTAIIISKKTNVTLEEGSSVVFHGNRAVSSGGAIYIVTGEDVLEQFEDRWCFLRVKGNRFQPQMFFSDNWAGKAGDVLYGGHLAIGYNGIEENCLQSFWNASDISQQKSLSVVASESSRVCFCKSELPDCLSIESTPYEIYPGQTISLSVVIVGQAFGSVAGSVFAQFIRHSTNDAVPLLISSQYTQVVGKETCNTLNYTVFTNNETSEAILALTPQFRETPYFLSTGSAIVGEALEKYTLWARMDPWNTPFPKNILEFPVYVNITLLPCPMGFDLRGQPEAKCECDPLIRGLSDVECDITDQTITRSGLVWIGTDDRDGNGSLIVSEYCPLNYCKSEKIRVGVGEYDTQCQYKHSGTLCGECEKGLSLALGSSQCLSCSNRYLVLVLPFLLAGIALVTFIKLANLTITHGTINGLVFYVNIVKANEFIFLPEAGTNPLTIFIAWANLDLGIETCFWDGLTAYSKAWLQFLFPLYIWAIAGGIVVLSKYSSRVAGLMGSNSVAVLATLFFLSYSKLLRIIIVGLSYTVIESDEGVTVVWSSNGNLEYLGPRHALLFLVCLATLLFLWLPYTLLFFCGQWLYKVRCQLVIKLLGRITPFLDPHYASLKGRHRYWFGAQLLIRATILIVSSVVPANSSNTVVLFISVAGVVLTTLSSLGFYQNKLVSLFEITFFANLSLLGISTFYATNTEGRVTTPAYVLISVVFLQFLGLVGYQISVQLKLTRVLVACRNWMAKKSGFRVMVEDDWEMFEKGSRLREEEALSRRQETEMREAQEEELNARQAITENTGPTY